MTVPLDTRQDIREMGARGVPRAQIARRLGVSRNTVAKHADMEDMSPAAPLPRDRPLTAVGPHAVWIDSVLEADLGAPRKRRHTARRIYDRLVAEGFPGLEWAPGTAQVDFGNFHCVLAGVPTDMKLLVVSLPHSNARYRVATRSERSECLCDGLARVFEWMGRARRARAGQRHRGRQDGARQGDGAPAVLAVQGPLPLPETLLQPVLRQREGPDGERRGLPAPQPARPGAGRPSCV